MMMTNNLCVFGDQDVKVPAHLNFGKFILDRLRRKKEEIALEHGETHVKVTYKEFTQYAVNMSTALAKLGVRRGDIVAVGSEKRNEFVPTVLAIVFTGATYTPYDLKSGRAVLKHKITITKPKYFICSYHFWMTYRDILKSFDCIKTIITLDDDDGNQSLIPIKTLVKKDEDIYNFEPVQVQGQCDTAFILYSSGTTGMPKGVQLTHLNCILNSLPDDFKDDSLQTAFVFGEWYHNYDTFMTYKFLVLGRKIVYFDEALPLSFMNFKDDSLQTAFVFGEWYHNYDTFMTYKFLVLGRKIVYFDEALPLSFMKCVESCNINVAFLVPSFVNYLSKSEEVEKINVDSLKIIYSRSSPLHNKTIKDVKSRFPNLKNVLQGYGMTEAGELTSESWATKGPKPGSVGMATPGITLKVVDPETREMLGPNQRGEICLRGSVFMKGYIGVDPSVYLDKEGFFKTGDLGYYDDDKYFYIVERLKEIIVYDGYKVAPLELETILQLHPGVREAGVVGKPVPVYGEEPSAFVVKQPGVTVTEKELLNYVASEVAPFMQLRGGVTFIEEIPRNPRGKIMRQRLREMLK